MSKYLIILANLINIVALNKGFLTGNGRRGNGFHVGTTVNKII